MNSNKSTREIFLLILQFHTSLHPNPSLLPKFIPYPYLYSNVLLNVRTILPQPSHTILIIGSRFHPLMSAAPTSVDPDEYKLPVSSEEVEVCFLLGAKKAWWPTTIESIQPLQELTRMANGDVLLATGTVVYGKAHGYVQSRSTVEFLGGQYIMTEDDGAGRGRASWRYKVVDETDEQGIEDVPDVILVEKGLIRGTESSFDDVNMNDTSSLGGHAKEDGRPRKRSLLENDTEGHENEIGRKRSRALSGDNQDGRVVEAETKRLARRHIDAQIRVPGKNEPRYADVIRRLSAVEAQMTASRVCSHSDVIRERVAAVRIRARADFLHEFGRPLRMYDMLKTEHKYAAVIRRQYVTVRAPCDYTLFKYLCRETIGSFPDVSIFPCLSVIENRKLNKAVLRFSIAADFFDWLGLRTCLWKKFAMKNRMTTSGSTVRCMGGLQQGEENCSINFFPGTSCANPPQEPPENGQKEENISSSKSISWITGAWDSENNEMVHEPIVRPVMTNITDDWNEESHSFLCEWEAENRKVIVNADDEGVQIGIITMKVPFVSFFSPAIVETVRRIMKASFKDMYS